VTFLAAFHHGRPSKEVAMERAHVRTKQLPLLQRAFERSRLEGQLIATAYELAVPVRRQALPTPQRCQADDARQDQPPTTPGGLSA
jgi:hypothetical protein